MIRYPCSLNIKSDKGDKKNHLGRKYKQTVVPKSFFSLNEVYISTFILPITNYIDYFNPVLSYKELAILENNLSHLCIKKRDDSCFQSFYSFFYKNAPTSSKQMISCIIYSFRQLLTILTLLNTVSLVFTDLHPKHLVIDNGNLIVNKLDILFHYPTMNDERKRFLFKKTNIFQPIEVYIISYLLTKNIESLSISDLEDILDSYCSGLDSLSLFEKEYIVKLKGNLVNVFKRWINIRAEKVIDELLKTCTNWNIHGASILFLILLRDKLNIREKMRAELRAELKVGFLYDFSQLLVNNLEKRGDVEQTILLFDDIVYSVSKEEWINAFV